MTNIKSCLYLRDFEGSIKYIQAKVFGTSSWLVFKILSKFSAALYTVKIAGIKSLPYSKQEMMNLYWVNWPNLTYTFCIYLLILLHDWLYFKISAKAQHFRNYYFSDPPKLSCVWDLYIKIKISVNANVTCLFIAALSTFKSFCEMWCSSTFLPVIFVF